MFGLNRTLGSAVPFILGMFAPLLRERNMCVIENAVYISICRILLQLRVMQQLCTTTNLNKLLEEDHVLKAFFRRGENATGCLMLSIKSDLHNRRNFELALCIRHESLNLNTI